MTWISNDSFIVAGANKIYSLDLISYKKKLRGELRHFMVPPQLSSMLRNI